MHSQPVEGSLPDSCKNVWMLFLNGLERLVFAMKIIPQPNYLTRQMLGLLGLYRGCSCLHRLLTDTIISCPMDLRRRGHSFPLHQCKYNLFKNSFLYSAPQCSHCKRCTSYGNSVCLSVCLSICPSVIRRYCVKTTVRSVVQFEKCI